MYFMIKIWRCKFEVLKKNDSRWIFWVCVKKYMYIVWFWPYVSHNHKISFLNMYVYAKSCQIIVSLYCMSKLWLWTTGWIINIIYVFLCCLVVSSFLRKVGVGNQLMIGSKWVMMVIEVCFSDAGGRSVQEEIFGDFNEKINQNFCC